MTTRRNFLKESALVAASLALLPTLSTAFAKPKKPIGIQLYTLKDIINSDIKPILEKVAAIGFKEVETYNFTTKNNFWGLKPQEFKRLLVDNGLTSPGGHFGFDPYFTTGNLDELKPYIEAANLLDSKFIVAPWLGNQLRRNADDYKKVAEKLNIAGELCAKSGLRVGYHNHAFEFKKMGDGITGFDIMLQETDAALVDFELDIYWAVNSGNNPIEIFNKYPKRFKMWHIKDMDRLKKEQTTEIGKGSIDYAAIFANAKLAGLEHMYVEQDNNMQPTPMQSVKTSFDFIKNNLL